MKYRYVNKVFEPNEDITIPDGSVGVNIRGYAFLRYKEVKTKVLIMDVTTREIEYGLNVEWLEPLEE